MPTNIIVADPSPSVQKTLQIAFPEPEFRLFPFEDGRELLNAVADIRPDAVLLSPALSGLDGYEVGRLLCGREDFRRVPLILLRGTFESLDLENIAASDYDEVVQKPFDSEKLAASVQALIEKKTSPSTFPEDPVLAVGGNPGAGRVTPAALPEEPFSAAGASGLRDMIRKEIAGTEREIEQRVRARVLEDVKEWMAGDGQGLKGTP